MTFGSLKEVQHEPTTTSIMLISRSCFNTLYMIWCCNRRPMQCYQNNVQDLEFWRYVRKIVIFCNDHSYSYNDQCAKFWPKFKHNNKCNLKKQFGQFSYKSISLYTEVYSPRKNINVTCIKVALCTWWKLNIFIRSWNCLKLISFTAFPS